MDLNCSLCRCMAAAMIASSTVAGANDLLTIDRDCDALLSIDVETGEVRYVSSLSQPVGSVGGLTEHQGALYLLTFEFGVETRLWEIDASSGLVLSDVEVTLDGASVEFAEGLASNGPELLIGFHSAAGGPFDSNAIGILNTDGTIVGASSLSPTADMDDFAFDPRTGQIWSTDGRPSVTTDFYLVSQAPPAYVYQGELFGGAYIPIEVEVLDGKLLALQQDAPVLYRIDATTLETVETIALSQSFAFGGLARQTILSPCAGDLNGDGFVDSADLSMLLAAWGPCAGGCSTCAGDFNGDGGIGSADLSVLLAAWGPC